MKYSFLISGVLLILASSAQVFAQASPNTTLDALHKAGADADPAGFELLLTEDVVFLGVDGGGRLEGQSARDFFSEHLLQGNAWAYRSSQRETRLSEDGTVAWFDESLEHDQLGRGRGTGVLIRSGEGWKVAQYNLMVPLPGGAVSTSGGVGAQATGTQEKKKCMMTSHKTNTRADC